MKLREGDYVRPRGELSTVMWVIGANFHLFTTDRGYVKRVYEDSGGEQALTVWFTEMGQPMEARIHQDNLVHLNGLEIVFDLLDNIQNIEYNVKGVPDRKVLNRYPVDRLTTSRPGAVAAGLKLEADVPKATRTRS